MRSSMTFFFGEHHVRAQHYRSVDLNKFCLLKLSFSALVIFSAQRYKKLEGTLQIVPLKKINAILMTSLLQTKQGWLVYPSSSLGWRYGANSNPGSRHQPN